MKKKYLLTTCLLFFIFSVIGQTVLSAGDVAITSFNSDTDDEISFILLKDITANTKIYLTQNGWDDDANGAGAAPNWGNTNQGTLEWTSSTAMKAGTQIQVIEPKLNSSLKVSEGNIVKYGTWSLITTSDSIIIYQGTAKPTDGTEVSQFIWAFNMGNNDWTSNASSNDTTGIPTGLVDGTNAVSLNSETTDDNLQYKCNVTSVSVIATLRTSLATKTNFNSDNSNPNYKAPSCITTTWDGSTDAVWNTADNWSDGIPAYGYNVTIPNVATSPIISSGTSAYAGDITIDASETLTINSTNALTLSGDLTITGGLTINGGGSLIVNGTSTGNVTYNRTLATTNWYSVSSPVSGEIMTDMRANNSFANGTGGSRIGFAPYDNSQADANNRWAYFNTSSVDPLVDGKGYTAKLSAAGTLSFTGTLNTNDVAIGLTQGAGNNYNLLGNPFTAFVNLNTFLANEIGNLTQQTVWIWDQGTNSYKPKNLASNFKVAPSQGFFVEANTANDVTFTEAMLSHEGTDTFQKNTNSRPEIQISVFDETNYKTADVYYINGTTTSFDNGYDSSLFGGIDNSFAVFSGLVSNSNGEKLAIQSLPQNNYESTIIPLGLNATSGKEITFSINHQNLPSGLMVFLEDRETKTITRLDGSNSNYKITLSNDSDGFGRFYVRTSTSDLSGTLAVSNFDLDQVSMYLSSKRNLRIVGLQSNKVALTVFNILGKKVFYKNLKPSSTIDVTLSNSIKQGIYIVKLETDKGNINKKIFLK